MTGSKSLLQGGRRKRRSGKKRSIRGGQGISNATSGSDYGVKINGLGDAQYARTFDNNTPGPAVYTSPLGNKVGGGRNRSKKGGFWGEIISQALVPFSILGMQQTYRGNKHGGKRTKRRRH